MQIFSQYTQMVMGIIAVLIVFILGVTITPDDPESDSVLNAIAWVLKLGSGLGLLLLIAMRQKNVSPLWVGRHSLRN